MTKSAAAKTWGLFPWGNGAKGSRATRFPLSIHASGRYFVDSGGSPFFLAHDAGWLASYQLNPTQIDKYINDRANRGFTGVIYQMNGVPTSNQTPNYRSQLGFDPFTTMTDSGDATHTPSAIDYSTANNSYLNNVDYFLAAAFARNMVVIIFPDYVGFPGVTPKEGFYDATIADTGAHLQSYGATLATRYGAYSNLIWGLSGDNTLSAADLTKQWNIVTGMRSVRTDQLIYVKAQRNVSSSSLVATNTAGGGSYPGVNVNNAYISNGSGGGSYTHASTTLTAYGQTPTMPVFVDEGDYELSGITDNDVRRGLWGAFLSGAIAGISFGNEYLFGFGGANNIIDSLGPNNALTPTYLATHGSAAVTAMAAFIKSAGLNWHLLAPQTGAALVTTSLGTAAATICAALASDSSCAMIYTGSGNGFTVALSAIGHSGIVATWLDPTNGATQTASGSPFANTGTHAFTIPGTNSLGDSDWILVLK